MNGSKFSTISSSLFNDKNPGQLPQWMEDLNIEKKDHTQYDLGIQVKGSFAEEQIVHREEVDATPRYLEASFNDTKLITDAKIKLAKFLTGKYYKTEANVKGNFASLNVKIDGLPAKFTFNFLVREGKLSNDTTFSIEHNGELAEYPFNKAGLDECINDIKSNRIKTSQKVESVGKTYLINKEEIIRRYNSNLRQATEKINEHIKAGDIIGVGSNTFASYYDVDYLFPQMEKEAGEETLPAFEFVPNAEHVAAKPYISDKILAVEASKTLSQLFSDFRIENSTRDNSELLVKAKILNNGIGHYVDFCFGIENEKIASLKLVELNDERMTVEQLLNKINAGTKILNAYLSNTKTAKRIYCGVVLTEKEIVRKLTGIVKRQTIASIIENWVERDLVQPVNSTTYTTNKSFEELLASINTKILTQAEIEELINYQKKFGSGLELDRQNVKDTGNRDFAEVEVSNEIKLANLQNYISKEFKNFEVLDFNGHIGKIAFIDNKSGTKHNISISANFDGNKITDIYATFDNKVVELSKVSSMFSKSPILSMYLQNKSNNLRVGSIILSERNLKEKLSNFVNIKEINNIINDWDNKKLIANIGNGSYVSKHSLEELLNITTATLLSEQDRREISAIKRYFGNSFSRDEVEDTGVREPEAYINDDTLLNSANKFLTQYFNNFQGENFKLENDVANYSVRIFDEESGLSTVINLNFTFEGNNVGSVHANLNNEKVSLNNIRKAFAMNEALSKYLELNPGKRKEAPMVMTAHQLRNRLTTIAKVGLSEVDEVINQWNNTGKVNKIASNVFASKHTFEQLLSMSNIKPLSDEEFKNKLARSKREHIQLMANHIHNNDTRALIQEWSPERMTLHAKAELNKIFKDFDFLDAKVTSHNYTVTARVVNPHSGIRQKLNFTFAMNNGNPSNLEKVSANGKIVSVDNIEALVANDTALNTFIDRNAVNQRNYKNLFSKTALRNKLSPVITRGDIDLVVTSMVDNDLLKKVNSTTYASDYSMGELISYLSKNEVTNVVTAKSEFISATKDERAMGNFDRIMNSDTRTLEAEVKKLSPKMIQLRDKIKATTQKAVSQKIITSKKSDLIINLLNIASTEKDLEIAWKELSKYFN